MSDPIIIDVVSDVVCPWCYLGKRRLEQALALLPNLPVTVHWRPFHLDPTIPKGGIDREEYLTKKFGSPEAVEESHQNLTMIGADEGIDYQFDRITRSPNTADAHRVIRWAAEDGLEEPMVERLFRAYFSEGEDIGDHDVLAALAEEVGLDGRDIADRLATDMDRDLIAAEVEQAQKIGVTGVPCFILDQRYAVMGAQAPEALAQAIRHVAEERASAPNIATA